MNRTNAVLLGINLDLHESQNCPAGAENNTGPASCGFAITALDTATQHQIAKLGLLVAFLFSFLF